MEEINIKELFKFYLSKIRISLIIVLMVVLIGAVYSLFFQKSMYESVTKLVLAGATTSAGTSGETGITQNDLNLNSKLVATYREFIKSKTVLKEVISSLDLEYTVGELEKMITVSSVTNTEMINITVKSENAVEAAEIANKVAEIFSLKIVDVYNLYNITVVDKAEVSSAPVNVNVVKQLVIYMLIGVIVAFAVVFIMFYFDTTLKEESQVEKLGLNVLCTVPLKMDERKGKNNE